METNEEKLTKITELLERYWNKYLTESQQIEFQRLHAMRNTLESVILKKEDWWWEHIKEIHQIK